MSIQAFLKLLAKWGLPIVPLKARQTEMENHVDITGKEFKP